MHCCIENRDKHCSLLPVLCHDWQQWGGPVWPLWWLVGSTSWDSGHCITGHLLTNGGAAVYIVLCQDCLSQIGPSLWPPWASTDAEPRAVALFVPMIIWGWFYYQQQKYFSIKPCKAKWACKTCLTILLCQGSCGPAGVNLMSACIYCQLC